ncbi:MAG: GxxExxY protein [Verrucomicrobia bacterium]|nr:MAG: GxxExxY protein [Verrucomicrobiota bacterium]
MLGVESETLFPHKEITEAIIGAAFEVHAQLGYGFLERVYHRALQVELLRRGFRVELGKRITVRYKDVVVGEYDADLLVEDVVLVEVKIAPQYDKRDEAQLLNELKATGIKLGLLLNFGRSKVELKRLVF